MAQQLQFATLTVPVPSNYQGFWDIIRQVGRAGKSWSILDVLGLTSGGVKAQSIREYVNKLLSGGYVTTTGIVKGSQQSLLYKLVKDQPEAPGLNRDGSPTKDRGIGRSQMWRSMKMLQAFNARELALYASTDDVKVTFETAQQYLTQLRRAGYLAEVSPAQLGGRYPRPATYRLIPTMNTGPLAPIVTRTDWVWDQNRRQVMGPEAGQAQRGAQ